MQAQLKQGGQDGPGLLNGIFERTIANFCFFGSFREEEF